MIGLGQPSAGDDAVGIHVLAKLREAPPPEVELVVVVDAMEVVELLRGRELAVLVDAWLTNDPAGTIRVLGTDALDSAALVRTSSHGTSLGQAIALGRTLYPADFAPSVAIVAVAIERAAPGAGLSPCVAAAVQEASDRVRALLRAKPLHD